MKNNEHACNGPKERSGTATVVPNLLVPITTLNRHVTAIAPPNGASLNLQTLIVGGWKKSLVLSIIQIRAPRQHGLYSTTTSRYINGAKNWLKDHFPDHLMRIASWPSL